MSFTRSTAIKIIVTILAVLFIIWYFYSNPLDFQRLESSNITINWNLFWIGILLMFVSNFLDGLAWHRILIFLDKRITAVVGLIYHFVGFSLGIFIPVAGTAELASKSVMLTKKYPGFTSEETVSSIAATRTVFFVTAYVLWGLLIISLGLEHKIDPTMTIIALFFVWIGLTVIIYVLLAFFGNVDRFSAALNYLGKNATNHKRTHRLFEAIKHWLENFSKSYQEITKMPRKEIFLVMMLVFFQSFLKWISVWFIYLAVLDLPFYVVMFISVAIGFVNLIPAGIPSLAGIREIATAEGISLFVTSYDQIWISTLLQSASLYFFFLVAFIVGLPYWLLLKPVKKERIYQEVSKIDKKTLENIDPI